MVVLVRVSIPARAAAATLSLEVGNLALELLDGRHHLLEHLRRPFAHRGLVGVGEVAATLLALFFFQGESTFTTGFLSMFRASHWANR